MALMARNPEEDTQMLRMAQASDLPPEQQPVLLTAMQSDNSQNQPMMAKAQAHDALTVPLSAPPQSQMAASPSTLGAQKEHINKALMTEYSKDENPYGSEQNHPGFLGKFLHGLNVATGGLNRRKWEEEGLEGRLQGIEKQEQAQKEGESRTALQGAQTENIPKELKLHQDELNSQLAEHGLHMDDSGKIVPVAAENLSPALQAQLRPKTEFETFSREHQGEPDVAEQFQNFQSKPLSKDQADKLNATWDPIAQKAGLPTGQFSEGMTSDNAKALQQSLNQGIGRQQGNTRITIQQGNAATAAANRRDAQTEKEYTHLRDGWNKLLTTYNAQSGKLDEAESLVGSGAMGDAIGSIKALSGLASGQGSGVRITQAELNSIAHARGYSGDFQAFMQKFGDGRNLTPEQETELKGVLANIRKIADRKSKVINRVLDDMGEAEDRPALRKIDSQARHALMEGQ